MIAVSSKLGSTPTEVVILEGQRTNPLPRDGKNSVAHRRGNPTKGFFADPDDRIVRRAPQGIVVEIALDRCSLGAGKPVNELNPANPSGPGRRFGTYCRTLP